MDRRGIQVSVRWGDLGCTVMVSVDGRFMRDSTRYFPGRAGTDAWRYAQNLALRYGGKIQVYDITEGTET